MGSVFGEGIADGMKRRSYGSYGGGSGDGKGESKFMPKPKLNLQVNWIHSTFFFFPSC